MCRTGVGNGVSPADVDITDAKPGVSPVQCPATVRAASASMTCTATYVTTQADVTAGKVDKNATLERSLFDLDA